MKIRFILVFGEFLIKIKNKIESLLFVSAIIVSVPVLLSFSMLKKKPSEGQQIEEAVSYYYFFFILKMNQ